ncbi:MAG: Polysaccharide pyruvyl transferase [candidate division WS2 bacterium ADurb.Bin280]|uniref:Polysaccharide pyruvyl transferase n=1 Tax=candidate division WS2 bacterium ADurb.Bin280 TaxID=1852829 RepID=A0A1V5SEB2_9BACT|nr:MAG: Polysaccharide pyruvyl transferase [candidate division WS2 bacterium ADurb.Bin280]
MEKTFDLKVFIGGQNWGDKISPLLVEWISGVKPNLIEIRGGADASKSNLNFLTVGSILDYCDKNSVVWGSGFIREGDDFKFAAPQKVCAVRGPLSRKRLLELGVECPEIFGDPALLFPRYYKPKILSHKEIGIVPHFVDLDVGWVRERLEDPTVRVIDINGDPFEVVDQICSCEKIFSSSLHGLIIADAYGVKSNWIKLSEGVWGDGYKFRDYFLSVGRKEAEPKLIKEDTKLKELVDDFSDYEINIDLDKLLAACPFRR